MTLFRIVEERKNYYLVDTPEYGPIRALLKGAIRKKYRRLSVGDFVEIDIFDPEIGEAIIRSVAKRKNELPKPAVANIDQVLFVNCLKEPRFDYNYIDRFLFAASVNDIPVVMLFNKIDLLSSDEVDELEELMELYRESGYEVHSTTMNSEISIKKVIDICSDKLTVFAGPSGVGKSSLLSKVFPHHEFITNELSEHISRGKNTTTHTSLLHLEGRDGYVADSPGFSMMKIPKIVPENVRFHFSEISEIGEDCKFANCLHENEPSCAVKDAVESGEIVEERYNNYLGLVDLMRDGARDYKSSARYI